MSTGWIIPSAVVIEAVRQFLNDVEAKRILGDQTAYEALLGRVFGNASSRDLEQIRVILAKDIHLVRNYPQGDIDLPAVVFVLADETRTKYVGDSGGMQYLGDEHQFVDTERWRTSTEIIIFSKHPLEIEWLHHLVKYALHAQRRYIENQGIRHLEQASSRDLGFEPRYLDAGQYVYRRSIIYSMEYDQVDADPELDTVTDVAVDALQGGDYVNLR